MNFYEKAHHQSAPCAEHDDLACSCFGSRRYGGGTTPLAAGVSVGHGLSIGENGTPTADSTSDGTWEYTLDPSDNLYYLTLKSGIWDFSNDPEIRCNVDINQGAVLKDGTINATVKNYGTIEGGTIRLCNNYGTIVNGTFDNPNGMYCIWNYNLISGGVFEQGIQACAENGMASKITDGTFKGGFYTSGSGEGTTVEGGTFASPPTNATGKRYSVSIGSWSGKCSIAINGVDFGENKSVYVVGQDYNDVKITATAFDTYIDTKTNTTKKFKEWQISPTSATLNAVDGGTVDLTQKEIEFFMPDSYKEIKLAAKYETVTTPTYDENLVIGADGKPVTENRKPYGDGVQGNGWTYNTKTDTLTILTGHTERFAEFGVNNILKVNVVVQKGATVERGWFYETVENHGTMSQAYFCGNVTNTGDGTMKKCTFLDSNFTGNLTITNEGEMEECIVMKNVTMLTNNGKMIRSSVGAETVQGNGTYDICLLAKNYEIAGTHKVTTKNETDKVDVRLVNSDGNECYTEGEETKVYFTGTPTLKVQIRRYDDGHMARIPLTNVNGDENYGIIPLENNFYIFAVPANSDVILNDTVKHTLTLNDAEIVNDDGTTPTSGTYVEGDKIRIRPNFGTDSEKVFDGWMSEDINVDTEIVYDDKTDNGTYILTMPGKNATVDAKYKDKAPATYTLTVVDGQSSTGKTSEELKEGKEVAVDANVPDDKVFTGWTASDGVTLTHNGKEVDLSENHLVFNMPAKTFTLTANFETARTNILFNEDGTLNLDGVKNNRGDGWYYSEGVLYLNPATATEYDFTHVNPSDKDSEKLDAVKVPIHVVNSTVTIKGGTFEAEVESTVADATFKNCIFKGEVDIQTICNVDNCIFTKSSTITNLCGEQNCLFEKEPGGSIMTYELTEKTGATVTATLDGCEGEVSGTTLYFSGTPTLKVKVADGIVEKANDKDVGKADANGWYTVTAKTVMAEDDEQIVLTKGEKTTPNPDDQPKTYTVTVKGGKINNETEVKAKKGTKLTVDVDESEVPEGMTFDVWSISFPKGVEDTLTGDPSVKLHDPHMAFTMPEADITIEAQYRSSELPGEDDGPSTLGTMATVAVGGAAAGILVWQGVSLGVDSYLQLNLPKGVAVPANRRELVVLLWETAGKPEAALPSLYSDVPAEEIELQKATRWAIDNGLVKPADESDASRFDPDRYVTKYDVFGAWLKLKKLMK